MLSGIFQGLIAFINILRYLLLLYCILSWFLPPYNRLMVFLSRVTDPLLGGIRSLLLRFFPQMRIDVSALIALFLLQAAELLLRRLYFFLAYG